MVKGKILKKGYTTGMCAAAAAKGAVMLLFFPDIPEEVEVVTPAGPVLQLKIQAPERWAGYARCCVIKDAGDDPDVTDGLAICATARQVEKGIGNGVSLLIFAGIMADLPRADED